MGRGRTLGSRTGVLAMVAALSLASALLWTSRPVAVGAPPEPHLHWWMLAPMFALAEVVVLHVQLRSEAQTISLSEIPLVLALLLTPPAEMLASVVLGSAAVYVLYRRQSAVKAMFNVALRVFGVSLMLFVLPAVAGPAPGVEPRSWAGALAAVTVAAAADGLLVLAVVAIHEGRADPRNIAREVLQYPPIAAVVGCLGLLAAISLHADVRTGPLLVVVCGALVMGYRTHASLNEQHLSLARLYDFGRTVAAAHDYDDIVAAVLTSARDLLRAEVAEIVLLAGPGEPDRRWLLLAGAGPPVVTPIGGRGEHAPAALWPAVLDGGSPLLVHRSGSDLDTEQPDRSALSGQLSPLGYREAIVVPLGDESGVWGTLLVADRLRELQAFQDEDIPLLETVGHQASLALANARLVARLRHDSLHDGLTGLANRAKFRAALQVSLDRTTGGAEDSCAVLLLDLDGFKEVNDSLGHHSGDQLLIHVAQCLTRSVFPPALPARLGGDEFAVLLPAASTVFAARAVADRIQDELAASIILEGIEVQVRASIGIALAPSHAQDAAALLHAADVAMYAAKTCGGGTRVFEDVAHSRSPRTAS